MITRMVMLAVGMLAGPVYAEVGNGGGQPESGDGAMESILFSFGAEASEWRVIDDGVMGGWSKGSWTCAADKGIFSGNLSLENNGGFSSVRSGAIKADCSGTKAFKLRVKGDGRDYQFRVRRSAAFDGASYRAIFSTTDGAWLDISLPLKSFEASFRGRVLTDYPPLTDEDIVTVGFLLADKKPGEFRLEVDTIALDKSDAATD